MAQESADLARRAVEAFNRRDVDGVMECVNPDFEWFPAMPAASGGEPFRGREGIEAYIRDIGDTWEEYRVVGQDFRNLGHDQVLVLSRIEGRGAGSGGLVDAAMGQIYDLRDGKISRIRTYLDHGETLRAAGLSESSGQADA